MKFEIHNLEDIEGEIRAVPFADNVRASRCSSPSCGHIHLLLCTPDDRPYTMAVLTLEQMEGLTEAARQIRKTNIHG